MKSFLLTLFIFFVSLPTYANQTEPLSMETFRSLPIQHEGRIKPLESYARVLSKKLDHVPDGYTEIDFLAEALFNPAKVIQYPLFKINTPNVKARLDIPLDKKLFSLEELLPGLISQEQHIFSLYEKEETTAEEAQLIHIYENATALHYTTTTFSALLPLNLSIPDELDDTFNDTLPENPTFMDFKRIEDSVLGSIRNIDNPDEKTLLLILQLSSIEQSMAKQQDMRIIPNIWDTSAIWLSPAQFILSGASSPAAGEYLNTWKDMAVAFRGHNHEAWNDLTASALTQVQNLAPKQVDISKITLEIQYILLNPYFYSLLFCGLALFIAILHQFKPELPLFAAGSTILAVGFIFHLMGLGIRMALLERPPVTNLYESILFVNAVILLTTLIAAVLGKAKYLFLGFGALCGVILYFTAQFFAAKGDTLEVLIAVLDTNFWLTTHVLIITTGYGLCIITSLLAHYILIQDKFSKKQRGRSFNPISLLHIFAIISLLLTAIGTILGGIWADQSWGRFWGWDPKENGALLIVLWLVWLLHSRISGHLQKHYYMAGMALLSVVVALAWFGINLLGIGLHSYGFTSGIAWGLGAFCAIEFVLISLLLPPFKSKAIST